MKLRADIFLSCLVAFACAIGCGSEPKAPATRETPHSVERTEIRPLGSPVVSQVGTAAVRGTAPIIYMVESACTVRILDGITNETLARVPVRPRTIVSITESNGITIGGVRAMNGPLARDRVFVIFLEASGDSEMRTTTVEPSTRPEEDR
jgi:hypothetical protein